MRRLFLLFCLCLTCSVVRAEEYFIRNLYVSTDPKYGTKVLTSQGEVTDCTEILYPTQVEEGTYEATITRKASNIYKIDHTDYYIETEFCYEYCYSTEVIIKIVNSGNYSFGTLIFLD